MLPLPRWVSLRSTHPTKLLFEHLLEQRLRPLQSLFGEGYRFPLARRVVDHALVMQTAERVPIQILPGKAAVVQGQIEQRQRRVVDLVGVEGHRETPAVCR